jgi:xanthine dehydrogenase accessory factor
MREIIDTVLSWQRQGKRFALATVVGTEGSSPRDIGATMAVSEEAEVVGSVSGGCVEGAVVVEALSALGADEVLTRSLGVVASTTTPISCARTLEYGYSDDEAFAVGLTCGGTLHIMVQPNPPNHLEEVAKLLDNKTPFVLATVFAADGTSEDSEYFSEMNQKVRLPEVGAQILVRGDGTLIGSLGNPDLDRVVSRDAAAFLSLGKSSRRHYGRLGQSRAQEVGVLYDVYASPAKMIIFGAVDFTAALARVAKVLGYEVTVCDARPLFATSERFPFADEVVVSWPDRYLEKVGSALSPRDALCVLTHDPKFDVPAICAAVETEVGYIGAMGSRRTHDERVKRLVAAGVSEHEISSRVHGPIGIDIGARTPEETAISIVAEIIANREGKAVPNLQRSQGRIHKDQ